MPPIAAIHAEEVKTCMVIPAPPSTSMAWVGVLAMTPPRERRVSDELRALADEAMQEHAAGLTEEFDEL